MDRLTEKEQKALKKAYRKHEGNVADPRFQERQGEIAEKYERERNKAENKLGSKHRKDYEDVTQAHSDYYE